MISPDGYIVTNNHVVEGVDEIKVRFSDGKVRDAKIIGTDPKTDLALIHVDGVTDLPALPLGDSDWILPGDFVVAIGNPFGLDHTVTFGIVSAKGRELGQGPYDDYLQIDAAINPGNSGGPLLDLSGAVVGINTAINPQANTIGFAVPINLAKDILPQLKEKGSVTRGWLGVSIQEITPELAKAFKLDVKEGALVAQVSPGSPADKAGLQRGDVILGVDGKSIPKPRDLSRLVASTPVGNTVKLDVLRDGKSLSLPIVIEKLAGAPEAQRGERCAGRRGRRSGCRSRTSTTTCASSSACATRRARWSPTSSRAALRPTRACARATCWSRSTASRWRTQPRPSASSRRPASPRCSWSGAATGRSTSC